MLSELKGTDRYGYEPADAISKELPIATGTFYLILKDEEYVETYLVESGEGPTRKYYHLTAKVLDMTDEVMADYETHFYMGLQNGKTKEQICEELGNIDEFVNELAGMGKADGDSSDKNVESSWKKQFNEQAQKFTESLNKGIDGFSKGVAEFTTEFVRGISDLLNSEEFKNVKHSGEEFINFGSSFFTLNTIKLSIYNKHYAI